MSQETDISSADDCCKKCNENSACGAWSFKANHKCLTFDKCGSTKDQSGTISGGVSSSPTPDPSPTPSPSPSPTPKGRAVVGFVGKGTNGYKDYNWNTLTHLAFWSAPDKKVRKLASDNGVKLFRNHGADCGLDCYTSDSDKKKAVKAIVARVEDDDLDGVFFDEEQDGIQMSDAQRAGYTDFVKKAAAALEDMGKTVFVCVGGRPSYEFRGYDYKGLAKASEFLFIMGYDMHFWDDYSCVRGGECSPAECPYPDIKDGVKEYLEEVSADKLVLGLPWYGQRYTYVGPIPFNEGQVDYKDVLEAIEHTGKTPKMIDNDKSWKLVCKEECISGHKGGVIWYDDADTLKEKYNLARDNKLKGVGVWKLDSAPYDGKHDKERDAMWSALGGWFEPEPALV